MIPYPPFRVNEWRTNLRFQKGEMQKILDFTHALYYNENGYLSFSQHIINFNVNQQAFFQRRKENT